jgi:hypothetical protein
MQDFLDPVPGAVVMPRCSSRAQSLPARTGTFSRPWCRSGEGTLHWRCLQCHGPSAAAAPQQASPELLGSQGPPALSQKAPPRVMRIEVRRAVTPRVVAHFEVQPTNGWMTIALACSAASASHLSFRKGRA